MTHNINHEYTSKIVCPYCGCKFENYCEQIMTIEDGRDKKIYCEKCEKNFIATVYITVEYLTERI